MKFKILILLLLLLSGCITKFIPEVDEAQELLVVEGMITDQPGPYLIRITKSFPLGQKKDAVEVPGCNVTVTDDLGNTFNAYGYSSGNYYTQGFQGVVGRKYTLNIQTPLKVNYKSFPMELREVPKLDSVYYEKRIIRPEEQYWTALEGAQIYLSTHDPVNNCRFYRWDFTETWEIRIPWPRPVNRVCWVTNPSTEIFIKSTTALTEDIIIHYPINYVTNETDRLKHRYSILVNQYSLSPEEYAYWEKLRSVTQNVGGLYDVVPASIPNNLYCVENPSQKVLGFFSVSGKSSMRKFIEPRFKGIVNPYRDCIGDTIHTMVPPPGLNVSVWVLDSQAGPCTGCPWQVLTYIKGCADCTVRGSNIKPPFWPY